MEVAAPRETVFDVIAAPYAERAPRAMRAKVTVLERGADMVLAAHYTPIRGRLRATTVETVRFRGLGAAWGEVVANRWEEVVAESFAAVKTEAERRAS